MTILSNSLIKFGQIKSNFMRLILIIITGFLFNFKASAQNIPLPEIINKVYVGQGLRDNVLYYMLGWDSYLIDTAQYKDGVFSIETYRNNKALDTILSKKKRVTLLSLHPLEIIGDTMRIRLSLSEFKSGSKLYGYFFGESYDSRDIECVYDKQLKKWVYSKTLLMLDF